MQLFAGIAWSHLRGRARQTFVSLSGIMLGVAFFLAVSGLMRGSERDFIKRLVDTAPHITVTDEFRNPSVQPATLAFPSGAVRIRKVRPQTEPRGIRHYRDRLALIEAIPGLRVAPLLAGQVIFSFAGRDEAVTLSGIEPQRMQGVTTIEEDMVAGSIADLDSSPDGIIIGDALARKLGLAMNDSIAVVAPGGNVRVMRIVGLFHTGRVTYDETQAFAQLARVQALLNRPHIANTFIIRLDDPYRASAVAARIESLIGYKSVSWQEANSDILSSLVVRNLIMYSVVAAILLVASFGIYNVISTVVLEKTRDIAILKSIGFHARDIRAIFLVEGALIGISGSLIGLGAGAALMRLMQHIRIHVPGESAPINLPVYWGADQFALAAGFAILAAMVAAYLPARRGASVQPVDILRGAG